MVLYYESNDEEIEHFEDIIEEDEDEPKTNLPHKHPENIDRNVKSVKDDSGNSSDSEVKDDNSIAPDSDGFDVEDELLREESSNLNDDSQFKEVSNNYKEQPRSSMIWSSLPGGYDPRHRDPSFCRAERASWWELTALASQSHPSASTMAKTLLSGAYNGNPLMDLYLTAFLDTLMEKKPKQATWMVVLKSNHLLRHFYTNKVNSWKKPKKKKKKKGSENEVAEEIFGVDGDNPSDEEIEGDDSDNEEIDNMLDSGDVPVEADGDYDYDNLDRVADEDDDSDGFEGTSIADEEDDVLDIGDDEDLEFNDRKRKRKSRGKSGASPFASLEEYDHLLKEDNEDDGSDKKKSKLRKKRKSSD